MKKSRILIILLCIVSPISLQSQWAGSSEPETRQTITPNKTTTKSQRPSEFVCLGIGIGGIAENIAADNNYIYNSYSGEPYQYIYALEETGSSSINFLLSGLFASKYDRIKTGYEIGIGTASRSFDYTGVDDIFGSLMDKTGEITSFHMGFGVPVRYNFAESKNADIYIQGTIGYGIISCHDDHENDLLETDSELEVQGNFYGGVSLGVRLTLLFVEVGYNTTGYLRAGFAF